MTLTVLDPAIRKTLDPVIRKTSLTMFCLVRRIRFLSHPQRRELRLLG